MKCRDDVSPLLEEAPTSSFTRRKKSTDQMDKSQLSAGVSSFRPLGLTGVSVSKDVEGEDS